MERKLFNGDCLEVLKGLPSRSLDAVVTDPPAGISFMGKAWDGDKGGRDQWVAWMQSVMAECLRVLKPGGHALVWALPRTAHWTAWAIEGAGFEVRDVVVHLFGCVTPDTEMLTEEGWKAHGDLRVGELVASVQPDGTLRYAPLRAVSVYPFAGELVRVKARGTDQMLTPGHRVWARGIRVKWQRIDVDAELSSWSAEQLAEGDGPFGCRLPLAAEAYEAGKSIGADVAALYGWVLAEGHFHRDVAAVSVYQNAGPHADEIRALLARLGIEHSEYRRVRYYKGRPREVLQFYLHCGAWSARIRRDLEGRKPSPPWWLARLPRAEAEALFRALVAGDGSWSGPSSGAFYQKSERTRAWFQALCCHLGYRTTENAPKSAVSFCTAKASVDVQKTPGHRRRWCSRVPYVGDVWCPTTIDGTWVARRAGRVFVTGNTGFPKSLDVSKAIDKAAGAEREVVGVNPSSRPNSKRRNGGGFDSQQGEGSAGVQSLTAPATAAAAAWRGWGTALKPAAEHWILARKPLEGTVAGNVLDHGCGALNIDGCRVAGDKPATTRGAGGQHGRFSALPAQGRIEDDGKGRWPANVVLSGDAPALLDAQSGYTKDGVAVNRNRDGKVHGSIATGVMKKPAGPDVTFGGGGGASRFFYVAKSSRRERGEGNDHPTVKPLALMQWLVRLVTPPGGTVLDPFMGSGTTGMACEAEGFGFIGIEQDAHYCELAAKRIGSGAAVEVGAAAPREEDSVAKGRTVKARDNENEHDSEAVEHVSYRLTVKRTDDAVRAAVGEYGAVEVSVSIHRGLQAGLDAGEAWEALKADVHSKVDDAFLSLGVVPEEE